MDSSKYIVRLNLVDYISLLGLFFSCWACLLFIDGKLAIGLAILFTGILMDAFDGWFARGLKLQRNFGRYLDGEIDVVMHLFAPALFFYKWAVCPIYLPPILFIVVAAGIIRLSVFNDIGNTQSEDGRLGYLGLPVFWFPFMALGSFILSHVTDQTSFVPLVVIGMLIFAWAMVYGKERYKPKSILGINLCLLPLIIILAVWDSLPVVFFDYLRFVFLLASPFVVTGIFHMLVVQRNICPALKIPINVKLFGANKTWRGVITFTVFTALGMLVTHFFTEPLIYPKPLYSLQPYSPILLGATLGLFCALGELPNSFFKRRMHIDPGALPYCYKVLCIKTFIILGDQLDSALPVALVYWFWLPLSFVEFLLLVPALAFSFFLIRVLLSALNLKKSAFQ